MRQRHSILFTSLMTAAVALSFLAGLPAIAQTSGAAPKLGSSKEIKAHHMQNIESSLAELIRVKTEPSSSQRNSWLPSISPNHYDFLSKENNPLAIAEENFEKAIQEALKARAITKKEAQNYLNTLSRDGNPQGQARQIATEKSIQGGVELIEGLVKPKKSSENSAHTDGSLVIANQPAPNVNTKWDYLLNDGKPIGTPLAPASSSTSQ